MGIKRFLVLPVFLLMAALALAQNEPAKSDQAVKPEPTPQAEQQAKPDEAAKPEQTPPQAEQAPKPLRLRISSSVAEGLKIKDKSPRYPDEARQERIQGDVLLQVVIDTQGNIVKIKVVQGDSVLVAAALDAVKQWKYKPYILNGNPVEVETTIRIQFHMR
jgi:TonB family protein